MVMAESDSAIFAMALSSKRAILIKRAKYIDVGIGRNQGNGHECTGQSPLLVMPMGCYKIIYHGMGI